MKVAVRYQSRSGNTKALADVIAETAGVTALEITEPITEEVDILFIGGGTYMGIDKNLANYLKQLNSDLVKNIAPFSTGSRLNILDKISELAKEQNIALTNGSIALKMGNKGVHLFGGHSESPLSEEQINDAKEFTKNVLNEF